MAQHDFNIANDTASKVRADINAAILALATNNSGSGGPPTPKSNMFWYDTSSNLIRLRNEANSAWITVGYVNQGDGKFCLIDDTPVVTTAGAERSFLSRQSKTAWEDGLSDKEGVVSPEKIAAAIAAQVSEGVSPVGVGQSWSSPTRLIATPYQNTTGRAVQIAVSYSNSAGGSTNVSVSKDSITWFVVSESTGVGHTSVIIPKNHYYIVSQTSGTPVIESFAILS